MTKTYIYGVPHGFDFYEKDAEFNDYFKGFYISSRRGRRLMINRRDNGETIYSYLRYGLKEVDRQPLHSFFGMSLVVDNYQFCPNFKVLLEWFDYLFEKLVNEHNIIKKNEDDVFHYVIHKFEENSSDVEWLKINLPNILTQADQTEIVNYDSSFAEGKAGQVVSFNQPVGENRLLETFKKYRWISVSSKILEKDEPTSKGGFDDLGSIELNYEELNGKLNDFNQQLLPIAVDISKGSYADLKRMSDEVQEITTSLAKYLPTIDDSEEKAKFGGLDSKYASLKESIGTLLSKLTPPKPLPPEDPPKPKTQYCFSCKQNKPLSQFRSPDATKCLECEAQDVPNGYKTCIRCGKRKQVRYFNQKGTDICDDCAKAKKKGTFKKIGKILMSKGFLGILASIVLVVGVAFAVINLPPKSRPLEIGKFPHPSDPSRGETIDGKVLANLVESRNFKAVYEYVQDKKDAANYETTLKDSVQKYLMSIVETPQSSKEGTLETFEHFYLDNIQLLSFLHFGQQDKDYLEQYTNDYFFVLDLLKSPQKITQAEKDKGNNILAKYEGLFPEAWKNLLDNLETSQPVVSQNTNKQTDFQTPGPISVSYTSKDNKPKNEIVSKNREIFIKKGTEVTINYPNGFIKSEAEVAKVAPGRPNFRKFNPDKSITVHCDQIGITITPVTPSSNSIKNQAQREKTADNDNGEKKNFETIP